MGLVVLIVAEKEKKKKVPSSSIVPLGQAFDGRIYFLAAFDGRIYFLTAMGVIANHDASAAVIWPRATGRSPWWAFCVVSLLRSY